MQKKLQNCKKNRNFVLTSFIAARSNGTSLIGTQNKKCLKHFFTMLNKSDIIKLLTSNEDVVEAGLYNKNSEPYNSYIVEIKKRLPVFMQDQKLIEHLIDMVYLFNDPLDELTYKEILTKFREWFIGFSKPKDIVRYLKAKFPMQFETSEDLYEARQLAEDFSLRFHVVLDSQ